MCKRSEPAHTEHGSRLLFLFLQLKCSLLHIKIGMEYCDLLIPMSKTENCVKKLGLVFEYYYTEDTCDNKKKIV